VTGRLAGKSAIVTGAARGLGRGIAARFAAEGARLLLADRDGPAVAAAAEALGQQAMTVDVSVKDEVRAMVERAISAFGGVDILVNNAGVFHAAGLLALDEAEFDQVMAVNVKSALFAIQAVAPHMMARRAGSIVNMASLNSTLAAPTALAYAVSKAAVAQLTNAAALALAPYGVRVNAIGPGTIDSDMAERALGDEEARRSILSRTPMGRLGTPEEVAGVALFLASEDSGFVTGKTIFVDGGRLGLNLTMPT
jgi:NAD(P)-dependent dehydrogenase (short-subunit alcohol dehydrogenase family)